MTNLKNYNLSVMMWDSNNVYKRADYTTFRLTNNQTFSLSIGGFSSDPSWNVRDSFSYHNGAAFSTLDKDNDNDPKLACAPSFNSPGWFVEQFQCQIIHIFFPKLKTNLNIPNVK